MGSNSVQLDYKTGYTWTALQSRTVTRSNTTAYSYYRIVFILVNGNELTFFRIFYNGYPQIPNSVPIQGGLGIGTTTLSGLALSVYGGNSYFNGAVGIGSSIPNTNFDIIGKIFVSNGSTASPSATLFGGSGDRLILYPGGASIYPYSLGINSSTSWYSSPSNHTFYCNDSNILTLTATSNLFGGPVGISTSAITSGGYFDVGGSSTSIMYSYLNGLRISGQDANTIWSQTGFVTITAGPTTSNAKLSVGNGNIVVNVSNTGTTMAGNTTINSLGVGTAADGTAGDLTVNNNIICNTSFYTSIGNNIVYKVQNVFPYTTTGGPFNTGYWLVDVSKYVSQSGYTYFIFNASSTTLNFV